MWGGLSRNSVRIFMVRGLGKKQSDKKGRGSTVGSELNV